MTTSETKAFMQNDSNYELQVDYQPSTNHLSIHTANSSHLDISTASSAPPAPDDRLRYRHFPLLSHIIHGPPQHRIVYLVIIICCIFLILLLLLLLSLLTRGSCPATSSLQRNTTTGDSTNTTSTPEAPRAWLNHHGQPCLHQQERLPSQIQPHHYALHIHPNLTVVQPDYSGNVTIDAVCWDSTDRLIFHSGHHFINSIHVQSRSSQQEGENEVLFYASRPSHNISSSPPDLAWEECYTLQQINVALKRACQAGEPLRVHITFSGTIRISLEGFYLSNYTSGGSTWRLATTQMEPYLARLAFPCFDEPAMKSTFQLNIVRDANHSALFNSALRRSVPLPGEENLFLDIFENSEIMSTYLVAFVVMPTDYVYIEDAYRNVTIRVYAPSSQKDNMRLALNATKKYLNFFEEFFGVPYTMSKLDNIAIPDFSAGAMENWGLVTYRPQTLLYNEKKDSFNSKVQVLKVVAHEVAHQWFGNIVTMRWWNDIWLNEGFASYMETLAADEVDTNFEYRAFNYLNYMGALRMDAVVNTHPVAVPENFTNADALFDAVSYKKGAALVEMMESFMGLANVKKGMQYYLNKHRYNNTVSNDLWDAMSKISEKTSMSKLDVRRIMNTWSGQSNFPVVHVTLAEDGKSFTVSQKRFLLYDGGEAIYGTPFQSPYGFKWNIPLKYITDAEPQEQVVWLYMVDNDTYPLTKPAKWVKVNHGHRGFFLTNYDARSWRQIINQLRTNPNVFTQQDRAGFLFDAFEIASSGNLDISVTLDLLCTLSNDTDFLPWRVATDVILSLSRFLYSDHKLHQRLQLHVQEIVKPLMNHPKISWDASGDSLSVAETMVRANLLKVALFSNEPISVKNAKQQFADYMKNESYMGDRNIFPHVLIHGLQEGTSEEWDTMWERYQRTTDPGLAANLRMALASTENWRLLYRLLSYSLDPRKIRIMDAVRLMLEMAKIPIASDIVWAFLQRYAQTFGERLGDQKMLVNDLAQNLAQSFMTEYHYQAMEAFFSSNPFGKTLNEGRSLALEQIQVNMHWLKKNLERVREYYDAKYPDV